LTRIINVPDNYRQTAILFRRIPSRWHPLLLENPLRNQASAGLENTFALGLRSGAVSRTSQCEHGNRPAVPPRKRTGSEIMPKYLALFPVKMVGRNFSYNMAFSNIALSWRPTLGA
jgi:hypothetical protein